MREELTITTEQVDDFPVLIVQAERMAVAELLDRNFRVHGNWQGLSLGWIGTTWLGHILSVGDHRLNHVQPWVEKNPLTCKGVSGRQSLAWILLMIGWKVFWMRLATM